MSKKILTVEHGKVKEHDVKSDVENSTEGLYEALSTYMGVPADKEPTNVIVTGIGAIEYACVVSKQAGVSKGAFIESVTNVWEGVGARAVRKQG